MSAHTHDGYYDEMTDIASQYAAYDLLYFPRIKECPSHQYSHYTQTAVQAEKHYMVQLHSSDLFLSNHSQYFCNYCLNFRQNEPLWFCTRCSFCLCVLCDEIDQQHIKQSETFRKQCTTNETNKYYNSHNDLHRDQNQHNKHNPKHHSIRICNNDANPYHEWTHTEPLTANYHHQQQHHLNHTLCDCDVISTQELQDMHRKFYHGAIHGHATHLYKLLSDDVKALYIWTDEQYSLILTELNIVPPYSIWYHSNGHINKQLLHSFTLYEQYKCIDDYHLHIYLIQERQQHHATPPTPQIWRESRSQFIHFLKTVPFVGNVEYAETLVHVYGSTELENKHKYYYEGQLAIRQVQRRLNALTLIHTETDELDIYDKYEKRHLAATRTCYSIIMQPVNRLFDWLRYSKIVKHMKHHTSTMSQVVPQHTVSTTHTDTDMESENDEPWTYRRFDARRKHVEFGLLPFRLVQASAQRLGTSIAGEAMSWSGLIYYMIWLPLNFITGWHGTYLINNTNFDYLLGLPLWTLIILISVQMWAFVRCIEIHYYWAMYGICIIVAIRHIHALVTSGGHPHNLRINLVMEILMKPGIRRWLGVILGTTLLLGGPCLGYILYLIYYNQFQYNVDLTLTHLYTVEVCTYVGACILHLFVFSANNYIKSPGRALHRTAVNVMKTLIHRTSYDVGACILSENIQRCTRRLASLSNTYQLRLLQELYAHQIDIVPLRVFVNTLKKHTDVSYTYIDTHHHSTLKSHLQDTEHIHKVAVEHHTVDITDKQLHPQQLLQHTRRHLTDKQIDAAQKKLRQVLRSELYGQAGLKAMLEDAAIMSAPAATVLHELLDKSDAEYIKSQNYILHRLLTGFSIVIAVCHSFTPIAFHIYDNTDPITVFSVAIALQSTLLIFLSLHNINALFWAAYADSALLNNLTNLLDNYAAFSNKLPPIKLIDEHHVRTWRLMRMYCIQGLQCRAAEFTMLLSGPVLLITAFVGLIVASLIFSLGIFELSFSTLLVTLIVDLIGSLILIPPLYYMAVVNKILSESHLSALKQQMCSIGGDVDHIQHLYDAIEAEHDTTVGIMGIPITFTALSTLPALIFTGIVSLASKVT